MASAAGLEPATSTFARWRSDLTELRGQLALGHLASVIGLAAIRPDLKGRLRELLCIHGRAEWDDGVREQWSDGFQCSSTPILHRSDFVLASGVGIAPTPPGLQPSVQTNYTIQWLVVPRGNAPRSSAYQAGALLLSYGAGSMCGFEPNRGIGRKMKFALTAGRYR